MTISPVRTGQRWVSRRDPGSVVTIHGKAPSGLWICSAASDRVTELISAERLIAEYRPMVDDAEPAASIADHEARRGSPRRRTESARTAGDDRAERSHSAASDAIDEDRLEAILRPSLSRSERRP